MDEGNTFKQFFLKCSSWRLCKSPIMTGRRVSLWIDWWHGYMRVTLKPFQNLFRESHSLLRPEHRQMESGSTSSLHPETSSSSSFFSWPMLPGRALILFSPRYNVCTEASTGDELAVCCHENNHATTHDWLYITLRQKRSQILGGNSCKALQLATKENWKKEWRFSWRGKREGGGYEFTVN